MATIEFHRKGEGRVGYARRPHGTRGEAAPAEIEVWREGTDPAGPLTATVTTEPCISTPVRGTLWGDTMRIDTFEIANAISRARLGTFEVGEREAQLRVAVRRADGKDRGALAGTATMRFEIEAWNKEPAPIKWSQRTGDPSRLGQRIEQQLDWAGFVTPEAPIVRRWVRAVNAVERTQLTPQRSSMT